MSTTTGMPTITVRLTQTVLFRFHLSLNLLWW